MFRDVRQARRAALAHLAGHDTSAGPVRSGVLCRCRAEEHAWHHGRLRCAGDTIRVVSADASGSAWRMVEVCGACAAAIPRTTVIPTSRPGPDRSPTPKGPDPDPVRGRPDIPSPRFAPAPAGPHAAAPGNDNVHKNPQRGEQQAAAASAAPAQQGRPRLTAPQAVLARQLVDFVAGMDAGPEARLLALSIAARAARKSQANLTSLDVRRFTDPQAALDELTAGGWITGDLTSIVGADPTQAFVVQAPRLTGITDPPMGKLARTRVSGWITRTLAAKPLKKTSAAARLAALGLVLNADPATGTGSLPDLPAEILTELDPGWITRDSAGGYQLTEVAAGYLPAPDQQN